MAIAQLPRLAASASFAVWLCCCAASCHADYGGTVALQSDGRYRGISYSDGRPQAQLTLAYDGSDGWYGGAMLSHARFYAQRESAQLQAYLGRVAGLSAGVDAEAGLSLNHFDAISRYDYAEAYFGLLGERWSSRLYYSNDYFGSRQRSLYAELNLNWPLTPSTQAIAHLGAIHGSGGRYESPDGPTRLDLRIGAVWRHGCCEVQLSWVAASRGGPHTWVEEGRQQTLVLGFSAAF